MINLLPELYKLQFSREYRWRVLVTALLFLDMLLIAANILLLPSFLQSNAERGSGVVTAPQMSASAGKNAAELHASLVAQTATLGITLRALTAGGNPPLFTDVITAISADKTKAISVTSISYSIVSTAPAGPVASVVMRGVATTRDDLAAFVAALKTEKGVSEVDVPISDYAADTAVPFTITVTTS